MKGAASCAQTAEYTRTLREEMWVFGNSDRLMFKWIGEEDGAAE